MSTFNDITYYPAEDYEPCTYEHDDRPCQPCGAKAHAVVFFNRWESGESLSDTPFYLCKPHLAELVGELVKLFHLEPEKSPR